MKDVIIRPSCREDFLVIYGRLPPLTCHSYTAIYEGKVAAIAGITMTDHGCVACMEMREGVHAAKLKIWKAAREMWSLLIAQNKNVVYAGADVKYPNSRRFLVKMGFEYFCDDGAGGSIFICRALKH